MLATTLKSDPARILKKGTPKTKPKKAQKPPQKTWRDMQDDFDILPYFPPFELALRNAEERAGYSPIDCFFQYFNNKYFVQMAGNSNIHYLQTQNKMVNTNIILWTVQLSTLGHNTGMTALTSKIRYFRSCRL